MAENLDFHRLTFDRKLAADAAFPKVKPMFRILNVGNFNFRSIGFFQEQTNNSQLQALRIFAEIIGCSSIASIA